MRLGSLLSLCLLGTACSEDLDPSSRVTELRLLAVEADLPFAQPNQQVQLNALAFDPEGRSLSWGWGSCIDPASTVASDCLQTLRFEQLTVERDQPRHTFTVPETDSPYVGLVVVVCPGTLTAGKTKGLPVSCLDQSGQALPWSEFEVGVKRIYLRDSALNHNPAIRELLFDGAPWPEGEPRTSACKRQRGGACEEYVEHRLDVRAPEASEASIDRDQAPIQEQAVVHYYATGGEFDDEVRVFDKATTAWHARPADAGKLLTFWFVVRDDRGGVSWVSRQVQVP